MLPNDDNLSLINVQTDLIKSLKKLKKRIEKAHRDHSIGKTVGSSVSIGGAMATLGGLLLATITAGASLALSVGGIASIILGTGTTVTTGVIQKVKSKQWAEELFKVVREHENQLAKIGDKIAKHPDYKQNLLKADMGDKFLLTTTPVTAEVGKVVKYLVIMTPHYGVERALAEGFVECNGAAALVINTAEYCGQNSAQMASSFKLGLKALTAMSVGITTVGIGLDIYTIVDTWVNKPGAVKQIDELVAMLENHNTRLLEQRV